MTSMTTETTMTSLKVFLLVRKRGLLFYGHKKDWGGARGWITIFSTSRKVGNATSTALEGSPRPEKDKH